MRCMLNIVALLKIHHERAEAEELCVPLQVHPYKTADYLTFNGRRKDESQIIIVLQKIQLPALSFIVLGHSGLEQVPTVCFRQNIRHFVCF